MAKKAHPKKVWKKTPQIITLEPVDTVIKEIEKNTTWSENIIKEKLICHKTLIRLPEAAYHIYRDSLE